MVVIIRQYVLASNAAVLIFQAKLVISDRSIILSFAHHASPLIRWFVNIPYCA